MQAMSSAAPLVSIMIPRSCLWRDAVGTTFMRNAILRSRLGGKYFRRHGEQLGTELQPFSLRRVVVDLKAHLARFHSEVDDPALLTKLLCFAHGQGSRSAQAL